MSTSRADREHPTPQHRVAHFMATFADYERLEAAFPLPRSIRWGGHEEDDQGRWVVVLHALMLRKYFQPGDRLQLSSVVRAVHNCVVKDDYPQAEWDAWEAQAELFQTRTIYNFGPESYTESELLEQHLYGRYLHGDFRKWMLTEQTPDQARDSGLWSAAHARAARVAELAQLVRAGVRDGAIVYEGSASGE